MTSLRRTADVAGWKENRFPVPHPPIGVQKSLRRPVRWWPKGTPAAVAKIIADDIGNWKKVVEAGHISVD